MKLLPEVVVSNFNRTLAASFNKKIKVPTWLRAGFPCSLENFTPSTARGAVHCLQNCCSVEGVDVAPSLSLVTGRGYDSVIASRHFPSFRAFSVILATARHVLSRKKVLVTFLNYNNWLKIVTDFLGA